MGPGGNRLVEVVSQMGCYVELSEVLELGRFHRLNCAYSGTIC